MPLYLQMVRGASTLAVGVELIPLSATFFWISRRSGDMASRIGPRAMMTAGMGLMGLGLLSLGGIHAHTSLGMVEGAFLVLGLGLGLNTGPVMSVAMAHASASRSGAGSGVVNSARMIGATLGVAVLGALFASDAGQRVGDAARFMAGFRAALWTGAGVLFLRAAVAALFVRQRPLETAQQAEHAGGLSVMSEENG